MLQHISTFSGFSVDNIASAKVFYEEVLGLTVEQTPQGLDIKLEGGGALFIYPKPDHIPATFTVLNFVVESIDTAVEQLTKKGVNLERYDTEMMKADEKGIYRGKTAGQGPDIAWFKDPAGNILSVLES